MNVRKLLIVLLLGIFIAGCSNGNNSDTAVNGETEDSDIIPVRVLEVKPMTVEWGLDVVGTISADREAQIPAEVGGQVKDIKFELGDYVRTGDVLIKLDDEYKNYDLIRAESAKMIAKADYEKSELDYNRYRKLFETNDVSEFELENMRLKRDVSKGNLLAAEAGYNASEKQFNDTEIKAPFEGFISRKYVNEGDMVGMNAPVAKIVDIRLVKINVEVAELDIAKLKVDQIVKINLDAFPGEEILGKITAISPEADMTTKTFPVEIKLRNTDDFKINPGMIAKGKIIFDVTKETFLLPQDFVHEKQGKNYIFMSDSDKARQMEVKVGRKFKNMIEILDGVSTDQKIITTGSIFLKDGSSIKVQ